MILSMQLGQDGGGKSRIYYIPPITLQMHLPPDYPMSASPDFIITAPWLSPAQINSILHALQGVANEALGSQVCYLLVEWLENQVLDHLGVNETFCISTSEEFSSPSSEKQGAIFARCQSYGMQLSDLLQNFLNSAHAQTSITDDQCLSSCWHIEH